MENVPLDLPVDYKIKVLAVDTDAAYPVPTLRSRACGTG
jgi:hypothetical protein